MFRSNSEAPLDILCLKGCGRVTNAGVQSLIAEKPLTRLDLGGTCVTDEILPTILGLPMAAKLELQLSEGQFSEAGLVMCARQSHQCVSRRVCTICITGSLCVE